MPPKGTKSTKDAHKGDSDAAARKVEEQREKDRQDALKNMISITRASAWPIHRWPIERKIMDSRKKVHLPRTYLARHGSDTKMVYEGQDLNVVVHRHYMDKVDTKDAREKGWTNFVTEENVLARRHEYIGPDPRVAGYHYDMAGEIHVRMWDAFLGDQWMDDKKWELEIELGPDGTWVEKED